MTFTSTLIQARAQARQVAKAFGHVSGVFDFFGFTFIAGVFQALAVAALLLVFLFTLLLRKARTLTARFFRQLRMFLVKVVAGGAFWMLFCVFAVATQYSGHEDRLEINESMSLVAPKKRHHDKCPALAGLFMFILQHPSNSPSYKINFSFLSAQ